MKGALPKLFNHQEEARKLRKDRFCLFFDTGTGKTRTALEFWKDIASEKKEAMRRTIIIAPLNVCRNWKNEIGIYCPIEEERHEVFMVAGGDMKAKVKEIQKFYACPLPAFLIINTDSFQQETYPEIIRSKKEKIDCLIIDEAHDFKNSTSNRCEEILKLDRSLNFEFLFILTGSPFPQGEVDHWFYQRMMKKTNAPFVFWRKRYFVDVQNTDEADEYLNRLYQYLKNNSPGLAELPYNKWKQDLLRRAYHKPSALKPVHELLTRNRHCKTPYIEWAMDMCDRLKAHPKWIVREDEKEKLIGKLSDCSLSVKKDEALDLPPLLRKTVYVDLTKEQEKLYRPMEKEFTAVMDDGTEVTAANNLVKMLRLQQICAGFLEEKALNGNRLKVLREVLEEVGREQCLIWTIFEKTYEEIAGALPEGAAYAFVTGREKPEDRWRSIEAFQAGEIQYLICHPKAGGVGVNLTAASWSIHYTKNFDLVLDLQAGARNYRAGSERHKRIVRVDLVVPDTVDEDIHESLLHKFDVQEILLRMYKRNQLEKAA